MQYDAKTPNEYLKMLAEDWRKDKLLEIRKILQKLGPELKEVIKYGMLSYNYKEVENGFALNAQKNSVNLYVGTINKIDTDGSLLCGLDVGKGCIRIKKSTVIGDTQIEKFIKKAIAMLRKGEDFGC